jgi:opacity protein-like surface antigen
MPRSRRSYASLALLAAILIRAAGPALAESPWYVASAAGAALRLDASRSTTFSNMEGVTGPGTNAIAYDPGPRIAVAAGYRLRGGFRIEGEFAYEHYALGTVSPLSLNGAFPALVGTPLARRSGGGRDAYLATVGAIRDLPVSRRIIPYIGVGFGVENYGGPAGRFAGAGGSPAFTERGANDTFAAFTAQAGVSLVLDRRWALAPSYGFEHLFTTGTAFANETNAFRLGLRYSF